MINKPRACARIVAALGIALLATTAEASDKLAIKAGRVITVTGEDIVDGVIVIEGGRITAVGVAGEVAIPWDAEVIDVKETPDDAG